MENFGDGSTKSRLAVSDCRLPHPTWNSMGRIRNGDRRRRPGAEPDGIADGVPRHGRGEGPGVPERTLHTTPGYYAVREPPVGVPRRPGELRQHLRRQPDLPGARPGARRRHAHRHGARVRLVPRRGRRYRERLRTWLEAGHPGVPVGTPRRTGLHGRLERRVRARRPRRRHRPGAPCARARVVGQAAPDAGGQLRRARGRRHGAALRQAPIHRARTGDRCVRNTLGA